MADLRVARSELVLGTPAGGQAARAVALAGAWLSLSAAHEAIYVACAQAWDAEMRERVARAARDAAPGRLRTAEEPLALAHALGASSRPGTLVVADALTLWLTALMMGTVDQPSGHDLIADPGRRAEGAPPASLADAIAACAGPLVLVGHAGDAGDLGGRDARQYAETLGRLDRQAAAACERVTLMSNGLPLVLKASA
ncbi:bifunctional adenosylcobinamide kinase/adenosylcobinamide-phosphate guanylyltransferase [Ramlibacter tataouinensis]|uniref:bifunctional adenosylcobinamide kinase/adenosylcobinamide-phosphate guanylyltransferase n=1 Tax=Ramlibacter tataouinensis TaxID=94132 RepID=UPI0022F3F7D0|nr:bifunctional adenosylcobinamide kinase/adenosylcobinamide-phosphate guanylyltransferase [Ramlibacter tataouinensis]WBY02315.1 bifunctional adenosylcobinamide kinase/adenosylcobinamide-phosphate guanylyltransferase [Ramlibacter tataouinensis]